MIPKRILNARKQLLEAQQTENADQTYTVNWATELDTDTISSSDWTSEDNGVTITNKANTTTQASCRLSGDVGRYRVVNKIVTAGGDTMERYINLEIMDNDYYVDTGSDYWLGYRGYWH